MNLLQKFAFPGLIMSTKRQFSKPWPTLKLEASSEELAALDAKWNYSSDE